MTIKASFIVPTRDRADILKVSLPLMLSQDFDGEAFEVIVVSDGSLDDTANVVGVLGNARLHFAELEAPSGAAAARNRAIDMARGELLVFVDDDSLIGPGFLAAHLRHHRGDQAIVTGPIIDVDRIPDLENQPRAGLFNRHWNPFPTGNASVARSLVTGVGGFDEAFRQYGWEDPELFVRMAKTGVRTVFDYRAPIYHYKPRARAAPLSERLELERMRGENGALFYAKHPTLSVGFQTKQLGVFPMLDRLVNRVVGLDGRIAAAMDGGQAPANAFMRTLMILHAEIDAGRKARRALAQQRPGANR